MEVTAADHMTSVEHLNSLPHVDDEPSENNGADVNAGEDGEEPAQHTSTIASAESGLAVSMSAARPSTELAIRISDLRFSYPKQPELLRIDQLDIPSGQHVAILGPSGSGKSTLLELIEGSLAPTHGQVLVNSIPSISLGKDACKRIGVLEQEPYVFNRTLRGNLRVADSQATDDECKRALELAGLDELLKTLPQGLDTVANEAGLRFSGGERQRIALARILLQDSPIVLLDEPTAGLDPITESKLLSTMLSVLENRTVVMVTHHLMGIDRFDRVLLIHDGTIAEDGTPQHLAKESATYQRLLSFDRGESTC